MNKSNVVGLPGAKTALDMQAVLARNTQVMRRFGDDVAVLEGSVRDMAAEIRGLRAEIREMQRDWGEKHLAPMARAMSESSTLYTSTHRLLREACSLLECDLVRRLDEDEERQPGFGRFAIDVAKRRVDPKVALLDDQGDNLQKAGKK